MTLRANIARPNARIVVQFSCGAASAVAGKLALAQLGKTHDVQLLNAYLANEHPDNCRFLTDCEAWYGVPITALRDEKYPACSFICELAEADIIHKQCAAENQ